MINVSILGSCVTRQSFNMEPLRSRCKVCTYIQRHNPFLLFQKPMMEITDRDIDQFRKSPFSNGLERDVLSHNFNRRMLKNQLSFANKDRLLEKDVEWLIIDSFYAQIDYTLKVEHGNDYWLFSSDTYTDMISDFINFKGDNSFKQHMLDGCINYRLYQDSLIQYLKKWDGRIIVINSGPIPNSFSLKHYKAEINEHIDEKQAQSAHFCKILVENLHCHLICLPSLLSSRDGYCVHYSDAIQEYIAKSIMMIIEGADDVKTSVMRLNYEEVIEKEQYRNKIKKYIKQEDLVRKKLQSFNPYVQARYFYISSLLSQKSFQFYLTLGDAYYRGWGVDKDDEKALSCYRIAYKNNVKGAYACLIRYYMNKCDSEDNLLTLYKILSKYVKKEDQFAIEIFTQLYYAGNFDGLTADKANITHILELCKKASKTID